MFCVSPVCGKYSGGKLNQVGSIFRQLRALFFSFSKTKPAKYQGFLPITLNYAYNTVERPRNLDFLLFVLENEKKSALSCRKILSTWFNFPPEYFPQTGETQNIKSLVKKAHKLTVCLSGTFMFQKCNGRYACLNKYME